MGMATSACRSVRREAHIIKDEEADALLLKLPHAAGKTLKDAHGLLGIDLDSRGKFEANSRASGQAVLQVHRCPRRG